MNGIVKKIFDILATILSLENSNRLLVLEKEFKFNDDITEENVIEVLDAIETWIVNTHQDLSEFLENSEHFIKDENFEVWK